MINATKEMLKACLERLAIVGKAIGRVQTWLLFTGCYFLVLGPIALLMQRLADPLSLGDSGASPWASGKPSSNTLTSAQAQY